MFGAHATQYSVRVCRVRTSGSKKGADGRLRAVDTSLKLQSTLDRSSRTFAILAIVLAVMAAGTCLRIFIADTESVWRDEAQAVAIAGQTFPSGVLEALKKDGNSPLFYLTEHFFVAARSSPHRELRDRSVSVVLGALCIPLVFFAGWEVGRRSVSAGIMAAIAVAASPVLVDLSTQARPYAGVSLVAAAMAFAILRTQRSGKAWILYGGAATVGFYLHALFATTIAAFAVVLFFRALRSNQVREWLVVHSLVFASIVPGLLFLHQQMVTLTVGNGRIPWGTTPGLERLMRQVMVMLTASEGGSWRPLVLGIAVLFLALAIWSNEEARHLASVAGLSLLASFALAIRSGGFETRYHVAPVVLLLIALSAGAPAILSRQGLTSRVVVAVCVAAIGIINVSATLPGARIPRSSARDVASLLEGVPAKDMIVIVPDTIAIAVNYYLPPRPAQMDPPELGRADVIDFQGWSERLSDPARIKAIDARIRAAAESKQALWLVFWQPMLGPSPGLSAQDAKHSALPAQWALGTAVATSASRYYNPVASRHGGVSLEGMTVIRFLPK